MSLYYLLSGLPRLVLGEPAPLDREDFLARCRSALEVRDAELVADLAEHGTGDHRFILAWREAEIQLRMQVALRRAEVLGRDKAALAGPGLSMDEIRRVAEHAWSQENPLDMELELDRGRWRILDELAGRDPFSLDRVLAYAVRLGMVRRWERVNRDRGKSRFEDLVEQGVRRAIAGGHGQDQREAGAS